MNKAKILMADNLPGSLDPAKEFLERRGYEVLIAPDLQTAQHLLETETLDLAILDVRLIDNANDNDISGIRLAKEVAPQTPKLILTAFPTFELVRQALGTALDGLPPAVGFVSKTEGLHALLEAIQLTLAKLPPLLEQNVLRELKARDRVALLERKAVLGPTEFQRLWLVGQEATAQQLTARRERESDYLARLRTIGLFVRVGWMTLLAAACLALFWKYTDKASVSAVASLAGGVIDAWFSKREDQTRQELRRLDEELLKIESDLNLLRLCDVFETPAKREKCREKMIAHILERRTQAPSHQPADQPHAV